LKKPILSMGSMWTPRAPRRGFDGWQGTVVCPE